MKSKNFMRERSDEFAGAKNSGVPALWFDGFT
jgi:hypothetical protein